jgi:hypothetical protein
METQNGEHDAQLSSRKAKRESPKAKVLEMNARIESQSFRSRLGRKVLKL